MGQGEQDEQPRRRSRNWETVVVEGPDPTGIAHLFLNRPSRHNALNSKLFEELPLVLAALDADSSVRVIVLKGSGKHFCSGIDLSTLADSFVNDEVKGQDIKNPDGARVREKNLRNIKQMQAAFTAFEECRKPVIAAIQGACIGGGVDMITACDLRYCCEDTYFSVKEVDLAIVADLGTLQRLPGLIGEGNAMEVALTGRRVNGMEAKRLGLVHEVFPSKEVMEEKVQILAKEIAMKSPLAVAGTKRVLLASRDLSVAQGLDFVALWNAAMLMSSDLKEALQAKLDKRKPVFAKL